jgi:hypothetical protein
MSDAGTGAGTSDDSKKIKLPDFLDASTATAPKPSDTLHDADDSDDDDDADDPMVMLGSEADELFDRKGAGKTLTADAGKPSVLEADPASIEATLGTLREAATPHAAGEGGKQTIAATGDAEGSESEFGFFDNAPPELFQSDVPGVNPAGGRTVEVAQADGDVRAQDATASKAAETLSKFDSAFPEGMKKLDIMIAEALKTESETATKLYQNHLLTLNKYDALGKEEANQKISGMNDLLGSAKGRDLEAAVARLELDEGKLVPGTDPLKSVEYRSIKAQIMISSGKDEFVKAGEKALGELVRDNPTLASNQKFQEQLINTYMEMTRFRQMRGLPTWNGGLKLDELLAEKKPATALGAETSDELLETASKTYFEQGIEKALPTFNKAQERADVDLNSADRKRLGLFIQSLEQTTKMAGLAVRGEDFNAVAASLAETASQSDAAIRAADDARTLSNAIGVNRAFAKIASGSPDRLVEGKSDLFSMMKSNGSLEFNEEFRTNARRAFKAHYIARNSDAHGGRPAMTTQSIPHNNPNESVHTTTKPEVPQHSRTDKPQKVAVEPPAPGDGMYVPGTTGATPYGNLDLTGTYPDTEAEKKIESYGKDDLTTVGMYAAMLGVGVLSALKVRNVYRQAREAQAASDLAHKVTPLSPEIGQPAFHEDSKQYTVKGRASDGRVVMREALSPALHAGDNTPKTEGPKPASQNRHRTRDSAEYFVATERPFEEVKPENFNPKKAQFGEYTPIRVDDKNYYADKEGRVFEYKGNKLKETSESRRILVISETEYGNNEVSAAIKNTDPAYVEKMMQMRSPETRMGSYFERVGDLALATPQFVQSAIENAQWKPYAPVDADGKPLVQPPARAFRAEIEGGRMGLATVDSLPSDTTFSLVDAKGTNTWSLVVDKPGFKGDKVNFATMIVGPEEVNGKPTGREVVWTVHPGDPVRPSPVTDNVLRERASQVGGNEALVKELEKPSTGRERRIPNVTLEQAKTLGFGLAKVESQPFTKLSSSAQAESARSLAARFDVAEDTGSNVPIKTTNERAANLLRDTAKAIEGFRPATTDLNGLVELEKKLTVATHDMFKTGRYDEAVSFRELNQKLESMQRDALIEQFQDKPRELLARTLLSDADAASRIAAQHEETLQVGGEGAVGAKEQAEEFRAFEAAKKTVAELVTKGIADGTLTHSEASYDALAKRITQMAHEVSPTNNLLASELLVTANEVSQFGKNGSTSIEGADLKFNPEGKLIEVEQSGVKYEPGRLVIEDGVLRGEGDIKGWIQRDPARVFEIAEKLSSGKIKEFDVKLGAAVYEINNVVKELPPQQIMNSLKEILRAEQFAVMDGKPANGLKFLFSTNVISVPLNADQSERFRNDSGGTRGVRQMRPTYYSEAEIPTNIDLAWKGLETGVDKAQVNMGWLVDATSRHADGVVVFNNDIVGPDLDKGTVIGVGDTRKWLAENPARIIDTIKLMSVEGNNATLPLLSELQKAAPRLNDIDRGDLHNRLHDLLSGPPAQAEQALKLINTLDILKETFPGGDFSSPEKAKEWLAEARVKQAIDNTSPAYMESLIKTRTPEGRLGSYFETVGDGKIATPESLREAIRGAKIVPFDPVDASGKQIIKPPARGFSAEIPGGRLGMVNLDSLPPGTKLSLVDPKGTGSWSLAVVDGSIRGEETNRVTFIIGPDEVNGKPTGKEAIWTFHPGDPVSPSPVNDQVVVSKNAALAADGKGIVGILSAADVPPAVRGQARRIDNLTVEQAKELGFGLAKVENPKLTELGNTSRATLLEQHAARIKPGGADGAKPVSAEDVRAAEVLSETAKALREFQPNSTRGDGLQKLQTEMKTIAEAYEKQGRMADAIVFNEAREAILPMAARSQANQLAAEFRELARTSGKKDSGGYIGAAMFIESQLSKGGFPENRWGYEMMQRVMNAIAYENKMGDYTGEAFEKAANRLRKIAESLPEAKGTRGDAGAATELGALLTGAADITQGQDSVSIDTLKEAHRKGNYNALQTLAEAERNPQNPRNAASYDLIATLISYEGRELKTYTEKAANVGNPDHVAASRASGVIEVADQIRHLSSGIDWNDMRMASNVFEAAIAASEGQRLDAATVKEVSDAIPRLRELRTYQVQDAMTKVLMSRNPGKALEYLKQTGALKALLPEVAALDGVQQDQRSHPEGNAFERTKMVVDQAAARSANLTAPQKRALMWAALLKDVGMPHTQEVSAVEGQPPKISFPAQDKVGAEIADKILDRMYVPLEERALIRDLVGFQAKMDGSLSDAVVKDLMSKHGDGYETFVILQEADMTGRGVHTPEQYAKLNLAEQGLPNPVGADGKPISAQEYWNGTVNADQLHEQEARVRVALNREAVHGEFQSQLSKNYGIGPGEKFDAVVKAGREAISELKTAKEVSDWLKLESNRESIGIKFLKATEVMPEGVYPAEWMNENPTRIFDVAVKASSGEYAGYDYHLHIAAGDRKTAARALSPQEMAAGIERVLNSPDPEPGLRMLKDARIIKFDPPEFGSEQEKREWIDRVSREAVVRNRADEGGLMLARSSKVALDTGFSPKSYETDREKVMSILERVDKQIRDYGRENDFRSADREAFNQVRAAYGRGEKWAIEMVHDALNESLDPASRNKGNAVSDVPMSALGNGKSEAYLKDFPQLYKKAVYDSYVNSAPDASVREVRAAVARGMQYLDAHPEAKPQWSESGILPANDDARAMERAMMRGSNDLTGNGFALALADIENIRKNGFESFAQEAEKRAPLKMPDGSTGGADAAVTEKSPTQTLVDRSNEFPSIKAGLDTLLKQGNADLAAQIIELKAKGKLPTKVEAYLTKSGADRLADPDRVAIVKQLVSESYAINVQPKTPGGPVKAPVDVASDVPGGVQLATNELHDTLTTPEAKAAAAKSADLMVTVSFTDASGVTTTKRMSLLDVPKEELGRRLDGLDKEKLATEIRVAEESIKLAEAEKRSADLVKLQKQLNDLHELKGLHEAHELAKTAGREGEFLAQTQARVRSTGAGHAALGVLAKAGIASAFMLLFNDLVPEFQLGTSGNSGRLKIGSDGT